MRHVLMAVLLAAVALPASAQTPNGGEFQVNSFTTGDQYFASAAMDANGDFVVAWVSDGQDGSGHGVRWRKFRSDGAGQAAAAANAYTTSEQDASAVAIDPSGNFLVAWTSFGQDGDGRGIYARRFDRTGAPVGGEFKVNGHTQGQQFVPTAAVGTSGSFVVTWMSDGQDGDGYGIFGRLYDPAGNSVKTFAVNTYTTGAQVDPEVAMDAAGNFVVVWQGPGIGDDIGISAQRFDAAGNPVGGEFQVNAYTTGPAFLPVVAMDPAGNFVVAWESTETGGGAFDVVARRFDSTGAPQSGDFAVTGFTTSTNRFDPALAMDEKGNFVIVWDDQFTDGDVRTVVGRQFDPSGIPQGPIFVANTYGTGLQAIPRVASSPDGDFVVTWQSQDQDGSGLGVYAQRFGDLVFEDSFDSGSLDRWPIVQIDGGDLSVTPDSALAGTGLGLRAVVNDTNSLFVEDTTPEAESRYRVRFYFDPNDFDPGEAQAHQRIRMFLARDDNGQRAVTIVLKRLAGQYSIEARARENDGTRVDTGFKDITNESHALEFDWQRATAPGSKDGSLVLYLDGGVVSTLSGLDNDLRPVVAGRLGALSLKGGAAGTLFFDQFESRRQRLIGLE